MKRWLLVTFDNDWADEMNVCGFSIFEKMAWENVKTAIENHDRWPEEVSFGTNENNEYSNAKELIKAYKVKEISYDVQMTIRLVFDIMDFKWGNFPAPWERWDTDDMEMPESEIE